MFSTLQSRIQTIARQHDAERMAQSGPLHVVYTTVAARCLEIVRGSESSDAELFDLATGLLGCIAHAKSGTATAQEQGRIARAFNAINQAQR